MKVFLERHEEVDTCLDLYFEIGYIEQELIAMEEKGITFEIDEIADYLHNEVFWILFEEQRLIKFDSLQYEIIEMISDKIYDGTYDFKNLNYLPKNILEDILKFIEFKYFSVNYSEDDYAVNKRKCDFNHNIYSVYYT